MNVGDKYTCAVCSEVFETNWTEAEALAELKKTYGDVSVQDCEMVCDECYISFLSWRRTRGTGKIGKVRKQ